MSVVMEEEIKRWTARRKSALVLDIIQGKTTVAEASRQFDIPPSEIESWVEDGKRGLENALRAKPEDVREQYERQLKELQEAYGEAMLELRARKMYGPPPFRNALRSVDPVRLHKCIRPLESAAFGHPAMMRFARTVPIKLVGLKGHFFRQVYGYADRRWCHLPKASQTQ